MALSRWRHRPGLDVHFFPTRRSSDLRLQITTASLQGAGSIASNGLLQLQGQDVRLGSTRAQQIQISAGARSEEHTSELQSREKLVCRLLLEKKQSSRRPGQQRSDYLA